MGENSQPMSIFNQTRLTNKAFKLDIDRMRQGWYSDKYFANVTHMFESLHQQGYVFDAESPRLPPEQIVGNAISDLQVEM